MRTFLLIKHQDGKRYISGMIKSRTYPSDYTRKGFDIIEVKETCHVCID